jgi:hypothetical protein
MNTTTFCDITSCRPLKVKRRFGGTYRLHYQSRRISRVLLSSCFQTGISLGLFFDSKDEGDMFLRNVYLISSDYTTLYPRRSTLEPIISTIRVLRRLGFLFCNLDIHLKILDRAFIRLIYAYMVRGSVVA